MSQKSTISIEIERMLKEFNLEGDPHVVHNLKCVAENFAVKILKDAEFYKGDDKTVPNKEDISFAILMDQETQRMAQRMDAESLLSVVDECNVKPLSNKETLGLKIPKDNMGNCNFQLENPNKKLKMEVTSKYENYTNKQFGNCFTFLMPQKHGYKPPNMGQFMFKNNPNMMRGDIPMKITIRPKFNTVPNMSMLKKD